MQDEEEKPALCIYCKQSCWIKSFGKRFDGALYVATCPNGKKLDRACDAIAEAEYYVSCRKNG